MNKGSFGIHKSWILLFLILAGIIMLFLGASVAMMYLQVNKDLAHLKLPVLFYLNTIFLIWSSFLLRKCKKNKTDKSAVLNTYKYVLVLSIVFLLSQSIAWFQLFKNNILTSTDRLAGFMYFFSGLHFLHVLGGLPFLVVHLIKIKNISSVLLPENEVMQFKLISFYWHFVDVLWIYLILLLSVFIYL